GAAALHALPRARFAYGKQLSWLRDGANQEKNSISCLQGTSAEGQVIAWSVDMLHLILDAAPFQHLYASVCFSLIRRLSTSRSCPLQKPRASMCATLRVVSAGLAAAVWGLGKSQAGQSKRCNGRRSKVR
ncbi:hypothetical protein, partial [Xanthomonas oryzae]|uniref:hypothetical protein n=1 Tax=Xanthomonas oryzae TaxID=347 RepID=UPI001C52D2C9